MTRHIVLLIILLALCILTTDSFKPFPKHGLFHTTHYFYVKDQEPIFIFSGNCFFRLAIEKEKRYLGHCPDDNSTAVGFYDEETYTLGGAWRVGGRGYGTFSYVWNGTFLQGNYSLYPLGTGYTLNEFIKELPPESNIPTVEV